MSDLCDLQGQSSSGAFATTSSITFIVVAAVSFLLLAAVIFLLLRRKQGFSLDGKVGLTEVIALEDLKDPKRNSELLSSIRRSRRQHRAPSCSSEQEDDAGDGVFLMVYLPSPYEQTLTRIARAASTSSSKDAESLTLSSGPETEDSDQLRSMEAVTWSEAETKE